MDKSITKVGIIARRYWTERRVALLLKIIFRTVIENITFVFMTDDVYDTSA